MAARSRGLGITSKDMEASRLVFVYVKDSKPRRKVAIPVPDSHSWEQFLNQVKAKLKLAGIADIYFSSTGTKVTDVSQLQDIDELCVVEGPAEAQSNGNGVTTAAAGQRSGAELQGGRTTPIPADGVLSPNSSSLQQRQGSIPPQDRHKVVVSTDGLMPSTSGTSYADEQDHKYARRAHPLKRTLQRLFPNMFAPGLPVTSRDALDGSADGSTLSSKPSRRRRYKRSPYNMRNLLLVLFTMCCVAMMLYLFIWVSSSPTMADMGHTSQQAAASEGGGTHAAAAATTGAARAAGAGSATHPDAAAAGAVPGIVQQPANAAGAVRGAGQAAGPTAASLAAGTKAALGAAEAAGKAAAAAVH